jgi:hypothetical protein
MKCWWQKTAELVRKAEFFELTVEIDMKDRVDPTTFNDVLNGDASLDDAINNSPAADALDSRQNQWQ